MSIKIALVAAVILLLLVTGAVVGGVVGSRKKDQSTAPPSPPDGGGGKITTTSSSTTSGTSTTTSSTSSATLPPYTPLPNANNFFEPKSLYSFSNPNMTSNDSQVYLEASYDPDTKSGDVGVAVEGTFTAAQTPLLLWQIRPVYSSWRNSTFTHNVSEEGDRSRTYWISSRSFGPDYRLTLDDPKADTYNEGLDMKDWRLHIGLKPKDLSDPGQYWYFLAWTPGPKEARKSDFVTIHNMKLGLEFTVCKMMDSAYAVMSLDCDGSLWEQWDVIYEMDLPKAEKGFNWVTTVESNPGSG